MKKILKVILKLTLISVFLIKTSLVCNADETMKTQDSEVARPSYISMFKCVAAGDYRYISVSDEGKVEYVRFSRSYKIHSYKTGIVGPEKYNELAELLKSSGFNRLNNEYWLAPPEEEKPLIEYEHVYYLIAMSDTNRIKSVFSHEYSLPQGMDKIIKGIEEVSEKVPDVVVQRSFLFALPGNMFKCLREDTSVPAEIINNTHKENHPYLYKAVTNPGYLVMDIDKSGVERISRFFSKGNLIRIIFDKDEYAVLLLVQK